MVHPMFEEKKRPVDFIVVGPFEEDTKRVTGKSNYSLWSQAFSVGGVGVPIIELVDYIRRDGTDTLLLLTNEMTQKSWTLQL